MVTVNILTKGFDSPNGLAFYFQLFCLKTNLNINLKLKFILRLVSK